MLPQLDNATKFRSALLKWYDANHRKLPWRPPTGTRPDPYRVLVSEAMLQQTQVATVVGYFNRFMERFPTIEALARADEQQVLRLWQGLGYYRRARSLHKAAQTIAHEHGGGVPGCVDQLMQLPGIGRYTAGAIASIAFGVPAGILDGNVERVLARLFAITEPINLPATRKQLWALAEELVPKKRPGDFNQAMMELGALVCLPRNPCCGDCPLTTICESREQATTHLLPIKLPRRAAQQVTHHVLAIERAGTGGYLFQCRPPTGLWSNMWQMPTLEHSQCIHTPCKGKSARSLTVAARGERYRWIENTLENQPPSPPTAALGRWILQQFGLGISRPRQVGHFPHQTTHRKIDFVLWLAQRRSGRLRPGTGQWRRLNKLDDLPMANPQRYIVGLLANNTPIPSA